MAQLLFYVAFALGVSFLCSLLEATLLSVTLATLAERQSRGSQGSGLLLELKRSRVGDALSAILILNTISNTLGATMAGAQATRVFESVSIGVFSAVLTLLILVFSEIMPKTLGAVYARTLSGFVGWILWGLTKAMAPALVVSGVLTGLLTRGRRVPFSRSELAAVITRASHEGALTEGEFSLFSNLLRSNEVHVEDVMTPRTVAFMMPADATVEDLLGEAQAEVFSRIPLYRDNRDNVVGYVLQRDVMRSAIAGCSPSRPLETFLREIRFIPEMIPIGSALQQLLRRREPIAVVTDEHGGLAGLVSVEDLTETILGVEIVDESDQVIDLRKAALELRDLRLERLRKKREIVSESPAKGVQGDVPPTP